MENYHIAIGLDKKIHHFEVGEYLHRDEIKCKYQAYENGELVATFEPDARNLLHICQNIANLNEELLYLLADHIEANLLHDGNKYPDDLNARDD